MIDQLGSKTTYAYDLLGELVSFTQSTGYGESYTYDPAGNMLEKVITSTDGKSTPVSMRYHAGNQMVSMTAGKDSIAYRYDANGSMVKKVLNSAKYGTLMDTYAYNTQDLISAYTGYDGYRQHFTYDDNGIRLSKSSYGNENRSTLEELLRGEIAGLPEIVEPMETGVSEEYEWATTEYLHDIAQEYYQVLMETTADENGSIASNAYTYGLERIAGYADQFYVEGK